MINEMKAIINNEPSIDQVTNANSYLKDEDHQNVGEDSLVTSR